MFPKIKKGGNTDGFGCHPKTGGTGNVFRGCRAWFNSDDGFDCIRSNEAVVFDSCWAFYNGYSQTFGSLGDGNGFKAGGYAYDEASKIPDSIPINTIQFCLAVRNKANGFYANHHLNGNIWLNNSAYQNSYNFNLVNRENPQSQNINVDGYNHILKNNLAYKGRSGEILYLDTIQNTLVTNTFDMNITLTDDDFVSLDQSALMAPRKADGSLPDIDFMYIAPSSALMDTATDIGFPFLGTAPEPGAFEQPLPKWATGFGDFEPKRSLIYPNPAQQVLHIDNLIIQQAWITDINGRKQSLQIKGNAIYVSQLNDGTYLLVVITDQQKGLAGTVVIRK